MAVASWLSAFTAFKTLRRVAGVPEGNGLLGYGCMIAGLKSAGKALLLQIETEKIDLSPLGVTKRNLVACLEEIVEDDVILELGLLEKEDPEITAMFEPSPTAAGA